MKLITLIWIITSLINILSIGAAGYYIAKGIHALAWYIVGALSTIGILIYCTEHHLRQEHEK